MTTIVQSRPAEPGQDHSYRIEPRVEEGCRVEWTINGRPVDVGTEEAGLRVEGLGQVLSVQVIGEVPRGTSVEASSAPTAKCKCV